MSLLILIIPLVAALLVFFLKGQAARLGALAAGIANLIVTGVLMASFDASGAIQHAIRLPWITSAGIQVYFGVDGISLLMLVLTNLLIPFILLTSFQNETLKNAPAFYGLVLLMQAGLNGVFMAFDGLLFYIFWELALIPIYFISALWGGEHRQRITLKFFIYTFVGSLLMLLSLLTVYLMTSTPAGTHSFEWSVMAETKIPTSLGVFAVLGFFAAFAVKVPIFPFHTWQPDTYTVSPTPGTMLLSGIMLKMGLYGMIRWMLPIVPEGLMAFQYLFTTLAISGVLYGAIIAIKQDDVKRLVAYSSLSHVGLIAAGILTTSETGIQGALVQMLNHGINVVGMFYVVDWLERRTGTRSLKNLGGLAKVSPKFAVLFMIVLLGSVAVPLTNGFIGEFLLLQSVYQYNAWMGAFAGLTIIFGAVYMLRVYQMAMYGNVKAADVHAGDLDATDWLVLAPIAALVIILGLFPQWIFNLTAGSLSKLLAFL